MKALEADAKVDEQMLRGRFALESLHAFEARTDRLLDLLALANEAEAVADRWWRSKRGRPSQIAGLVDDAFTARRAVLEAREEAGLARCTLLAMTGVAAEDWPRGDMQEGSIGGESRPAPLADEVSPIDE